MRIDLHNHTMYSDGVDTIEELIDKAKKNNVDYFAITDHDSVLGVLNCDNPCVIKGIELSTYYNESIHLVGLFKNNVVPQYLIDYSKDFLKRRKERAIKMVNNLKEIYGIKMNLDELLEDSDIRAVTRGNMARNIAKYNDISVKDINFYLSKDSKAYIPITKISVSDGIKMLKKCGCFVILAHPHLYNKENLEAIKDLGYDGIETNYPYMTDEDKKYILDIANKYNYIHSAGSDCHGDFSHAEIGTATLSEEEFEAIRKEIGFNYVKD